MPVTADEYRLALRAFPSGVTIVAIRVGEQVHGLTVSAFASVSVAPPLVTIVIDHQHRAFALLETPGAVFSVNILHTAQSELANRFAWTQDEDRFLEGDWRPAATGAPILADALAWLDCTLHSRLAAGTHTVYVGEVQAAHVATPLAAPLVYWNRDYRKLETS
jgi:flavin reductase (DIM6/NTAB) family NADH-FMN oxidoreductase RutF